MRALSPRLGALLCRLLLLKRSPWNRAEQCDPPARHEGYCALKMQGRDVLGGRRQLDDRGAVSDPGLGEPLLYRVTASVGLDDDDDAPDSVEVRRVPVFNPTCRAGKAERRDAVVPKSVTVALAFNEVHLPGFARCPEPVEPVEMNLGPDFPPKLVVARARDPEAGRQQRAGLPEIGDAHGRPAIIRTVGQPEASQKLDRQILRSGVLLEGESGARLLWLFGCFVVCGGIRLPPPSLSLRCLLVKEIGDLHADRGGDLLDWTAGVAFEEPLTVAVVHAQRILLVGVSGATACPAVASLADALQVRERVHHTVRFCF